MMNMTAILVLAKRLNIEYSIAAKMIENAKNGLAKNGERVTVEAALERAVEMYSNQKGTQR